MRLAIQTSTDVPDDTYFTTTAVDPDLDGARLTIYAGQGRRRSSWGAPGVSSTVVVHDDDLAAVHVGYHHKHRGGQFWRYYVPAGEGWRQVPWSGLDDGARTRVLDAAERTAPAWAKVPGKLRSERPAGGVHLFTAYKIVRQAEDGRLLSVYDGTTAYTLGKRLAQKAADDHGGGYYSYLSASDVLAAYRSGALWPRACYDRPMTLALLECEVGGTTVDYGRKISSTFLRPLRILQTFAHTPSTEEVA